MGAQKLLMCACLLSSAFAFSMDYVSEVRQNFDEKSNSELVNQMAAFQRASLVYMAYASYFDRSNVHLPGFKRFFKAASEASLKDAQKVIDYINHRGGHQQFPLIDMNVACKIMKMPKDIKTGSEDDMSKDLRTISEGNMPQICDLVLRRDSSAVLKDKKKFTKNQKPSGMQQSTNETWKHGLKGLNDGLLMERALNTQLLDLAKGAANRGDKHLRHFAEDSFLTQQTTRIKKLANVITRLHQYSEQEYPLGEYVIDLEMSN